MNLNFGREKIQRCGYNQKIGPGKDHNFALGKRGENTGGQARSVGVAILERKGI